MRTLKTWFFKLTNKNWKQQLANAKATGRMIADATLSKNNHFYDINGTKIRGWQSPVYHGIGRHPLVEYYNKK